MASRIGFIGVGLMGHGMAKNLVEKGFDLTVMGHRNRAPVDDLLKRGAKEAKTPAELAGKVDILFLCVTGSPQVEQVVLGDNGIVQGAKQGLIVVDSSTSEPESTRKLAADLAKRGIIFVDAPLTRSPVEAEAGRLNTMVGASDEVIAKIRPALEAFSENIFHAGKSAGAGHTVKLLNNFLGLSTATMVSEAVVVCERSGADPRVMFDICSLGGGDSRMMRMMLPKALEGDYTGLQFALSNARKDIGYYTNLAAAAGVDSALGATVHATLSQAVESGYADQYIPTLIEHMRQRADGPVRKKA
jgi:3-hydroxyisobutyrate dehydrogenase-like beta-hydroxyacid dehydrogenase